MFKWDAQLRGPGIFVTIRFCSVLDEAQQHGETIVDMKKETY